MSGGQKQLGDAQHWLLAAITSRQPPSPGQTENCITPGPHQSPAERLDVYRNAYLARLLEVLRELFPCTRFAVGDDIFDQLMLDYLEHCPPRSYTLAKLADRLVEHLDATRPDGWGEFVVELARLEEAIDRVFDAPGGESLSPLTLPDPLSGSLRLTLTPGLELLSFRYPVSTFYTAWKHDRSPEWPEHKAEYVALLRREFIVRRYELSKPQFELLQRIAAGTSLDEALAALAVGDEQAGGLAASLRHWFAFWTSERFFADAHIPARNGVVKSPPAR